MKHKILSLLISCLYSLCLYAQEKKETTFEQRAQYIVDEICAKITVTVETKDNLVTVFRLYFEDVQTYRAEGNDPLMKALAQTRDSNISDVLKNEAQFREYQDFIEDYKFQKKRQGSAVQEGRTNALKKENN